MGLVAGGIQSSRGTIPGLAGLSPAFGAFWGGPRPGPLKKGGPAPLSKNRAITWQQPTLAGPNVLLPLAAEGLTAVFGMGTGGAPRL